MRCDACRGSQLELPRNMTAFTRLGFKQQCHDTKRATGKFLQVVRPFLSVVRSSRNATNKLRPEPERA